MSEAEREARMIEQGYKYRLDDLSINPIAPLYVKTLTDVGTVCRDWSSRRFEVHQIAVDSPTKQS